MIASITIALLGACNPASPDTNTTNQVRTEVLNSLADSLIAGHYAAFHARTVDLVEAAESCDIETMRSRWWSAREPWKHAETIGFGPVVEYPERLGPILDDWPANVDAIGDLLDGDGDLSVDAFSGMGSATRGFPVVEHLLWSASEHPRFCEAVKGAVGDLSANAALIHEAWTERWSPANPPSKDYLNLWVNYMAFTAENIHEMKLGKPNGDYANGQPQPDLIESRPSGRSLQDARDALEGVRMVWAGNDSRGIRELIVDTEIQTRTDDLLAIALERLNSVPDPLEATIYDEPEIIGWAQRPLLELQSELQREVATALNVTVLFNPADGD